MIAGLSKTIDALIKTSKDSEKQINKLKSEMSKEDLKFINAFESEIKAATKNGDLSKITDITKKYFEKNDTRK